MQIIVLTCDINPILSSALLPILIKHFCIFFMFISANSQSPLVVTATDLNPLTNDTIVNRFINMTEYTHCFSPPGHGMLEWKVEGQSTDDDTLRNELARTVTANTMRSFTIRQVCDLVRMCLRSFTIRQVCDLVRMCLRSFTIREVCDLVRMCFRSFTIREVCDLVRMCLKQMRVNLIDLSQS